jgi:hypothetical protein
MVDERFDAVLGALASATTRRGALATLAGLTGLGLSDVAARRRHKGGKSRGKAKGKSKREKFTICHRTGSETDPFQVISVAASAVPAHEARGDLVSCPNLQVIDFETCACVCPAADIVCENGQQLDPATCACGSPPPVCVPEECTGQNNACTTCSCRRLGPAGSICVCGAIVCPNGTCNPDTGCPS